MSNTTEKKMRTITLTDRAPVTIDESKWPVIASARSWDNTYECQANRTWRLTVRQHADGRTLVYGVYTTQFQKESGKAAGEIVTPPSDYSKDAPDYWLGDEIAEAIKRVAANCDCDGIADDCIADLPAVELE